MFLIFDPFSTSGCINDLHFRVCLKVDCVFLVKIVICQMTVLMVGVGAKTRTLKPNPYNRIWFEGSSVCPCFSTLKSVKNGQFSTLKIGFRFKGLRALLDMLLGSHFA